MKEIYHDLSGDSRLLRQAFPSERAALLAAAAAAGRAQEYERTSPDAPTRIYRWEMSEEAFETAFAPWLSRLAAWQDDHHAIVNFHSPGSYVMLLDDGADPVPECPLPQCYLGAVFDDVHCLLREARTDKKVLRKAVCRLAERRWQSEEFVHPALARKLGGEKAAALPDIVREKIRLIQGADVQSDNDIAAWMEVVSSDAEPVVLTDRLNFLGFPGVGQAVYRVTLRDGSKMLVVEQISSYVEGYVVDFTFISDRAR